METLKFDLSKKGGKFKILNATNGGPWHKRHTTGQYRSNFEEYKAARIPYSRNHDSAMHPIYGGPYSHDITCIFPNFDADVNDPASYDFACTDESILVTLDAGTETFFRLGQTIEHQIKKHGTLPPADFNKWAEICEHIIMHYNYGWADGYELGIEYWEIWNEPDLGCDSPNKPTWGGTPEEFFEFFEISAKHLKKRFPNLKIGGPAFLGYMDWGEAFLSHMQKNNVPMDFFSWHVYPTKGSQEMTDKAYKIKNLLEKYGYGKIESILNEWNYVRGWKDKFQYSIDAIHGLKGAAFVMSCICDAPKCDAIDMLMYYDTRPSVFCGVFDFYNCKPLKGYYPLYWYGMFYDMESEIRCEAESENIYTLCGTDKEGKVLCVVVNYSDDDDAKETEVKVDFGKGGRYEIYKVDSQKDGQLIETTENLEFTLENQSFILIKEI